MSRLGSRRNVAALLAAHAADLALHSSGQELDYVEDISGVAYPLTTVSTSLGLSRTVPNQSRPVWLMGEAQVDVTTAPAAGGTGVAILQIKDSSGLKNAGAVSFEGAAGVAGLVTVRVFYRVPANTPQDTYTLYALRAASGDATFRASLVNSALARTFLSAEYR